MVIEKEDDIAIIKADENLVSIFLEAFDDRYTDFKTDNIILDFSEIKNVTTEDVMSFNTHSETHKKGKKSFVIVSDADFNELADNENIVIVPTLLEAKDIIEMEKIERDLGF